MGTNNDLLLEKLIALTSISKNKETKGLTDAIIQKKALKANLENSDHTISSKSELYRSIVKNIIDVVADDEENQISKNERISIINHQLYKLRSKGISNKEVSLLVSSIVALLFETNKETGVSFESKKHLVSHLFKKESIQLLSNSNQERVQIDQCLGPLINIQGKILTLSIINSSCKVIVDSTVSSIEIVNCYETEIQVTGHTPTIVVEGCDGIKLILSSKCKGSELIYSMTTDINVFIEEEEINIPLQNTLRLQ